MTAKPTTSILLCTFNGEKFLEDQLASIEEQTFNRWQLIASDDGSTDRTLEILHTFAKKHPGKVEIKSGPKDGFVRNFLSITCNLENESDFYAFCDQDDIWLKTKLEESIAQLSAYQSKSPTLYCSRSKLIDEKNREIGLSPKKMRNPSFENAIVQNIASGNTMVFNEAARQLLLRSGAKANVPFHDWWLYMLVTGCGGTVIHSQTPSILYRQHNDNIMGSRFGLKYWALRFMHLKNARYRCWMDMFNNELAANGDKLSTGATKTLALFQHARSHNFLHRYLLLRKAKVYRQSTLENMALSLIAIANRV